MVSRERQEGRDARARRFAAHLAWTADFDQLANECVALVHVLLHDATGQPADPFTPDGLVHPAV
jgi:hypothetical protein